MTLRRPRKDDHGLLVSHERQAAHRLPLDDPGRRRRRAAHARVAAGAGRAGPQQSAGDAGHALGQRLGVRPRHLRARPDRRAVEGLARLDATDGGIFRELPARDLPDLRRRRGVDAARAGPVPAAGTPAHEHPARLRLGRPEHVQLGDDRPGRRARPPLRDVRDARSGQHHRRGTRPHSRAAASAAWRKAGARHVSLFLAGRHSTGR